MFLQLDGTFIVQLINFAIFFALLNVLFLRPVSRAIRKRREYINSLTSDYDRYQAEAKALRAQADDVRLGARRQAEATITKARNDASNEAAELSVQFTAQATVEIERAHATVESELQAARANESTVVADLAELMVQRTIVEGGK